MFRFQAFWVVLLLWSASAQAQFVFQNLKEEDGLSTKDVRCLYRDADGFLWIGTSNGLNRFDGNVVKCYPDNKAVENVEVNGIQPIGKTVNLLVGTSDGLKVFNKSTGTYIKDARFQKLARTPVLAIKRDDYGRLWFISNNQIYLYQGETLSELAQALPWAKRLAQKDMSFAARNAFCWDKLRKGFWVGGYECFFVDCKNKVLYDSTNNPHNWPILRARQVTSIALDKRNNLWYGSTIDFSLHYLDTQSKSDTAYLHMDGKRSSDGVNAMFVDSQDRLWISTWMYAAYVKERGKPIRKIPYSQDAPYSIAYGFFKDVLQDSESDIWFATINGLSKLTHNTPFQAVYKLPSTDFFLETNFASANSIAVSGDTMLAMKEDGVVLFNTNTKKFKRYFTGEKLLVRNRFFHAAKAGSTWWMAGAWGLYFLEKGAKDIQYFDRVKKGAPTRSCNFVFVDDGGKIWFQIIFDALYRYDPVTKQCDRFDGKNPRHGLFSFNTFQSFAKLRNGDLAFAAQGQGLVKFSRLEEKFTVVPVPNKKHFYVTQFVEDKQGDFWAAVWERGLYKIDHQGKFTDSLYTKNGLLVNQINSLAVDRRGAIWAAGPGGMLFFFSNTKKITHVKINLGKTMQDYWNYVLANPDYIYAVMLDHVVVIDPLKFSRIPVKQPPHITSVKVFENEISDYFPQSLVLPPEKDFITIQFASLKYRDIPSLQYSYQLTGIDKSWVNAGRNMSVSYNSLSPGYYAFKVRSTDENEHWMKEATVLNIRILPFWWQTWWFYIIVGVVSSGFSCLIYRGYVNRKHKREYAKTIDYFVNSVYGENSVSEICWDIARSCCSLLRFEDCTVFLWDKETQKLVQKATYGLRNANELEIINPLELEPGEGIVGIAAVTKKTINVPDTSKDTRYIVHDTGKFSEIAVPILHEGKLIGVLDSEHSKKKFFTEEHVHALVTIASINANKISEAQAEEEAAKKEMMLLEINRMLAESQLMALRAQMNPHFVFNCLNSIQECIVTQKYGEASKYLNKFSRLFRMVLNNSDRNLVTVEEEKDVLELYLELEQMRFEQSFVYSIDIDQDLEADDILLPSMLLQPYVENAIWHGLMHKKGYRELKISFKRQDEDIFTCMIEDNGIGRKKSLEIKAKNAHTKRHKSKGLQIAKDRLDLIDRQGQHASVEIVDKYDAEDNATGTMIVIELSTSLDYN